MNDLAFNHTAPEYLCIGHLCHDLHPGKHSLGGTAAYAGLTAQKAGKKVGILTSVGEDFEFFEDFKNIHIHNIKSERTTLFENVYADDKRTQFIHARASKIEKKHLPADFQKAKIVHICPIADEVDYEILTAFPNALVGLTPQGWMRGWGQDRKVFPKAMDWEKLAQANVVIMSDADISGFERVISKIASLVNVLVLTHGAAGASVFHEGKNHHFPSFPVIQGDPTGAGDVFAAAFFIKYAETKNIASSTGYAHAAASLCVEAVGKKSIPEKEAVEKRSDQYRQKFL